MTDKQPTKTPPLCQDCKEPSTHKVTKRYGSKKENHNFYCRQHVHNCLDVLIGMHILEDYTVEKL